MKFCNEAVDQVLWTATNDMAYFNLPVQMAQHWTNVHELNGALVDVIKFLAKDFKVRHWPLNPTAPLFDATVKANSTSTTKKEIKKPVEQQGENEGWKTVSGQYKPKKQRSFSWDIGYENRYDILNDNDELQPNEIDISHHTDNGNKEKKETADKIISTNEIKMEILDEKYDVELVTNDALTALLESLNEDHVKAQQESTKTIEKLQYDSVIKKDRLKKELKTVRQLNDHYKDQLQKNTNEKREYEKKCSSMKSKVTEMEAQMLLFQDTLTQNDELQRENDQYQHQIKENECKIKKLELVISEKDNEMKKTAKEQEKDKSQIEKLTKKISELKYNVGLYEFITQDFMEQSKAEGLLKHNKYMDSVKERQQKQERKDTREQNRQRTRYKGNRTDP